MQADRPLSLFENALAEKVQIVVPLGCVVGIPVDVPDMRHAVFLEVLVNGLANPDQTVAVAAGEPDELQLFRNNTTAPTVTRSQGRSARAYH